LLAFWNPGIEGNIDKLALIEKLLSGQGDEVKYMKIDVSRKNRIARKFNVVDVPSLLLLKDSKVIRTILANDKRVIAEFLDEYARGKCNES
jgi:thioredoxin reductase (NADPH)